MSPKEYPTREEVSEMCRKMEKKASRLNREPTQICVWVEGKHVWADATNLDWLADKVKDVNAKKLRAVIAFNIDGLGPYYFYNFS